MDKLIPIECKENIPHAYRDTPIGQLLEYHNLGRPFDTGVIGDIYIVAAQVPDLRERK